MAGENRKLKSGDLSPAESDVFELMLQGLENSEIADALGRALKTIERQVHSIYQKKGIRNRTKLIVYELNARAPRAKESLPLPHGQGKKP